MFLMLWRLIYVVISNSSLSKQKSIEPLRTTSVKQQFRQPTGNKFYIFKNISQLWNRFTTVLLNTRKPTRMTDFLINIIQTYPSPYRRENRKHLENMVTHPKPLLQSSHISVFLFGCSKIFPLSCTFIKNIDLFLESVACSIL